MGEKRVTSKERETPGYQIVKHAILYGTYHELDALLRRQTETFMPQEASALCRDLIETKCTLHAFRAVLAHCPPLQDFVYLNNRYYMSDGEFTCGGLVMFAAKEDHVPVLQYLLEKGCDPNIREGDRHSPLEAALREGSLGAVELLMQRDDVDFAITDHMRNSWSMMGKDPEHDRCFRAAAGRLLGEGKDKIYSKIPLLPGLTVIHAAERSNWTLVCRLCRETEVTVEQVRSVLGRYSRESLGHNIPHYFKDLEVAPLVDALLAACPAALEDAQVCRQLAFAMLFAREEDLEHLHLWAEKMPGRDIVPEEIDEKLCRTVCVCFNTAEDAVWCLRRWKARLGSRFPLVLLRSGFLPYGISKGNHDDVLRMVFEIFTVKGRHPKSRHVSRLAEQVLWRGSPALIGELCARKILFAQESAAALLDFCEKPGLDDGDAKRAILAGYLQKEPAKYEL